ncbi:DUF488 family protein [Candidatus Parvarchaeota archaeon]|nr:DUF488 family protein [Candidatus Parvarchaeota archaeon]
MLYAKTTQDKPADSDGYRLLVTKLWPKKFKASWADGFNPNLSPSQELYGKLTSKQLSFDEFASQYSKELDAQLERLKKLKKQAESFDITLVSYPDFEGKSIGGLIVEKCKSL